MYGRLMRVHCVRVQANHALKEGYKRMRESDAVPGASRSYRMTVRQLEALIRLSEALARMRCTPVIRPQFVKEVSTLSLAPNLPLEVYSTVPYTSGPYLRPSGAKKLLFKLVLPFKAS